MGRRPMVVRLKERATEPATFATPIDLPQCSFEDSLYQNTGCFGGRVVKVRDTMSRHVNSVDSRSSILEAAQMLLKHRVSGLPVIDDAGNLIGAITSNDILRHGRNAQNGQRPRWLGVVLRRGAPAEDYSHLSQKNVREVMSTHFNWTTEEISIRDVERFLMRSHMKWLPVMRNSKLVGTVNRHGLESANLLLSRMAKLQIEEKEVVETNQNQMRELHRLCLTCESQRRCRKDLENSPTDPVWQQYCRNSEALITLKGQREGQRAAAMIAALGRALEAAGI